MSGSLLVDIILVVIAIGSMTSGWRQGGLSAVLSLLGVLGGGYLSVKAIPTVLDFVSSQTDDSTGIRFVTALAMMTIGVVLGYALSSSLGQRLRDRIRTREALKLDSGVGAVVQVITTLLVIWLIMVPLVNGRTSNFAEAVKGSTVMGTVGRLAPDFIKKLPTETAALISASGFPVITDPLDNVPQREVEPPDPALQASPVVQQTRDSIVRVVGEAEQCRRLLQGSGFAIEPDTIMTNAHVVAGTDRVKLDTTQGLVNASVTYYNPREDIALVKIEDNVRLPALQWADQPGEAGQSAIVLGFPQGGPFQASPARIRQLFTVSGPDIYADHRVDRESYSLRGDVVQGNSGGPLIDESGNVLGLVFGADVNQKETGYALSKAEVMKHVQSEMGAEQPADTGACVLH